jgi:hypothetical protein
MVAEMAAPGDRFGLVADMMGALHPNELATAVQRAIETVVARQARILVVDDAQTCLVAATAPGRAKVPGQAREVGDHAGFRTWFPLRDATPGRRAAGHRHGRPHAGRRAEPDTSPP